MAASTRSLNSRFGPRLSATPVWQLEIRGRFEPDIARLALRLLARRHPIVAARVRSLEAGASVDDARALCWELEPEPDLDLLLRVEDGRDGALERVMDAILDHDLAIDAEYPLRLTWVPTSDEGGWLLMAQHHALADGVGFFGILEDFVGFYDAVLDAATRPEEVLPVPRLPEEPLVEPRPWRRALWVHAGNLSHLLGFLGFLLSPPDPLPSNPACGESLDFRGADRARHLVLDGTWLARCRALRPSTGLSVNECLCGALGAALRRWSAESARPVRRFNLFLPFDLRPRGGPLLSSANHISAVVVRFGPGEGEDPLRFARTAHRQIRAQIVRQLPRKRALAEIQAFRRFSASAIRRALLGAQRAMFSLPFSNLIAISPGQRTYHARTWEGLALRVMTPCGYLQGLNVTVLAYAGKLCFNFNYKASVLRVEAVDRLIDLFREALEAAVAPPTG
jgi:hypothetical protein